MVDAGSVSAPQSSITFKRNAVNSGGIFIAITQLKLATYEKLKCIKI